MKEIILETLGSLKEYIPKMIAGTQEVVKNLQGESEPVALQLMPAIVDGLQWILQAVTGLQKNGQLQDIELDSLTKHFNGIVSALEMRDYVLLVDLLDYEIAPVLKDWLAVINTVEYEFGLYLNQKLI